MKWYAGVLSNKTDLAKLFAERGGLYLFEMASPGPPEPANPPENNFLGVLNVVG